MGATSGKHDSDGVQPDQPRIVLTQSGMRMYAARLVMSSIEEEAARQRKAAGCAERSPRTFTEEASPRAAAADKAPRATAADADNPVVDFLAGAGLAQYAEALLFNGFDDMESLALLDDEAMVEMGFPRGHMIKMRKRLRSLQQVEATQPPPTCQQVNPQPSPQTAQRQPQKRAQSPPKRARPQQPQAWPHPAHTPNARSSSWPSPCHAFADAGTPGSCASVPVGFPPRSPSSNFSDTAATTQPQSLTHGIRQSWVLLQALGIPRVVDALFNNLMRFAPGTLALFGNQNDDVRPIVLMGVLTQFVRYLGGTVAGELDCVRLVQNLMAMGAARVATDVTKAHWTLLGHVLDLTLRRCLAEDYTLEVQQAWLSAYDFMASVMMEGMRSAKLAAVGKLGKPKDPETGAEARGELGAGCGTSPPKVPATEMAATFYRAARSGA